MNVTLICNALFMRNSIYLLLLFLLLTNMAWAQTTINLPLVVDKMPLGVALVNPSTSQADLSIVAYAPDGQPIASAALTLQAGRQTAKLAKEIFSSGLSVNGGIGGWIQITSASIGLQGFEIFGDFEHIVDGVDGAQAFLDQILPAAGSASIFIANPQVPAATVTVKSYDAAGLLLHTVSAAIPGNGVYSPVIPGQARQVRITASIPVAASIWLEDILVTGRDQAALNGFDVSSAPARGLVPHAVHGLIGAANYSSLLGVANPTAVEQKLTITFKRDEGDPIVIDVVIPPNGSLQKTIQELFQLAGTFQSGWIQMEGTGQTKAFLASVDATSGSVAVVPMQTVARTEFMFAQEANLPPWLTGLVLLNTSQSPLNLEVYGMNSDGSLVGVDSSGPAVASLTLPAGTRTAKLIEEILPAFRTRATDGGFLFVRTTNNTPFFALEQFFLRDGAAAVNVAAGALPQGVTYNPPSSPDRIVSVSFWNTPDCSGPPVSTNRFPVNYGSDRCYTWPGRSGENSASNFVCSENSMSYTQWTTLTCSGGQNPAGTRKTTYTDRCTQDFPPTLYSRIADFSGCR